MSQLGPRNRMLSSGAQGLDIALPHCLPWSTKVLVLQWSTGTQGGRAMLELHLLLSGCLWVPFTAQEQALNYRIHPYSHSLGNGAGAGPCAHPYFPQYVEPQLQRGARPTMRLSQPRLRHVQTLDICTGGQSQKQKDSGKVVLNFMSV